MKKKPQKLAFSFLEISVVIMVLGILVVVLSKGTEAVRQSRLNSARAATTSSPINAIDGLFFWVESTLEASFGGEIENDNPVSTWYDIAGQQNDKRHLSGSSTTRPLYKESGINDRPAPLFDGTDDYLSNSSFQFPFDSYSIFIVFRVLTSGSQDFISTTVAGGNGIIIETQSNGVLRTLHRFPFSSSSGGDSFLSSSGQFTLNKGNIFSYVRNFDAATLTSIMRVNATQILSSTPTISAFNNSVSILNVGSLLGTGRFFNGYLGEIIIFNRALTDEERNTVEQYLSTKWGIKLN